MDDTPQLPPFDHEHLKQQIAEAIRTVIRERVQELGMNPESSSIRSLRTNTAQPIQARASRVPRVAAGPPEAVVKEKRSYSGTFFAPVLGRREAGAGKRKGMEAAE